MTFLSSSMRTFVLCTGAVSGTNCLFRISRANTIYFFPGSKTAGIAQDVVVEVFIVLLFVAGAVVVAVVVIVPGFKNEILT